MKSATRSPRIGLALGGGGARGWAHLGVLKALAERNITIHAYSGTSIGALVGGFAAAGRLSDLEQILSGLDLKRIIQLFGEKKLPRAGLIDGRHIVELIRKHIGYPDVRVLPTPFCTVATDIESGQEVVMKQGDLVTAIRASIAIPGIFTPVKLSDRYLVDGGLVNPLPVLPLKNMGVDVVIAVNLHGDGIAPLSRPPFKRDEKIKSGKLFPASTTSEKTKAWLEKQKKKVEMAAQETIKRWLTRPSDPNIFSILANSVDIISAQITSHTIRQYPPDILIEPKVGDIGHMEFHRVEEGMRAGYSATVTALEKRARG